MKFNILDEEIILENNEKSIEIIFEKIREVIDLENYNFECMIIDDKQIDDDFEFYIEENIEDIKEITVVFFTDEEIIASNIDTAKKYIKGAIPLIDKLSNSFLDTPSKENYNDLSHLYEATFWIIDNFKSVDKFENKQNIISNNRFWDEVIKGTDNLEEILNEIDKYMNSEANTIGDILGNKMLITFKNLDENLDHIKLKEF